MPCSSSALNSCGRAQPGKWLFRMYLHRGATFFETLRRALARDEIQQHVTMPADSVVMPRPSRDPVTVYVGRQTHETVPRLCGHRSQQHSATTTARAGTRAAVWHAPLSSDERRHAVLPRQVSLAQLLHHVWEPAQNQCSVGAQSHAASPAFPDVMGALHQRATYTTACPRAEHKWYLVRSRPPGNSSRHTIAWPELEQTACSDGGGAQARLPREVGVEPLGARAVSSPRGAGAVQRAALRACCLSYGAWPRLLVLLRERPVHTLLSVLDCCADGLCLTLAGPAVLYAPHSPARVFCFYEIR